MRKWTEWKKKLVGELAKLASTGSAQLPEGTYGWIFDVELGLRLMERLQPGQPATDVWALLTGYPVAGVSEKPEARRMCAVARQRIRTLRTAHQWKEHLALYAGLSDLVRMYDVALPGGKFSRRSTLPYMPERERIYDGALQEPAEHEKRKLNYAKPGTYSIIIREKERPVINANIQLTEQFLNGASDLTCDWWARLNESDNLRATARQGKKTGARSPITVTMADLEQAAVELHSLDPGGDWGGRMDKIHRSLKSFSRPGEQSSESADLVTDGRREAQSITIDKLFHLVGMMGSGKSTLISILVYHLVRKRGLHVTLMLSTVAESLQRAAELRKLGIKAAPALGSDRYEHRLKYGVAHNADLSPTRFFLPPLEPRARVAGASASDGEYEGWDDDSEYDDEGEGEWSEEAAAWTSGHEFEYNEAQSPASMAPHEHAMRWLTAPCALSAAVEGGQIIPPGKEPCFSLMQDGRKYVCPLLKVCPVHQATQDLFGAQVWVVNPASFIHTRSPGYEDEPDMRMLEAIYRNSDLLVIDEADKVQVQWDLNFAPTDDLFGQPEALISWLRSAYNLRMAESGPYLLRQPLHNKLTLDLNEVTRFADWMLVELQRSDDLVKWLSDNPLTNSAIYSKLAEELSRPEPKKASTEWVREKLKREFQRFFNAPTSLEEGGDLAELLNDVRFQDEEPILDAKLETWLNTQLEWSISDSPQSRLLLRKLRFALMLTGLDTRLKTFLNKWAAVSHEYGERTVLEQGPPDEYADLVPEAPMSNLFGYQYVRNQRGIGGILRYLRCRGMGRWLITNLDHIYEDLDGTVGPHVFLASATSWSPGSPQFHLAVPPTAVLSQPTEEREAIENGSVFEIRPIFDAVAGQELRVSGTYGEERMKAIRNLVRNLAQRSEGGESFLEKELRFWQQSGQRRKILIVVGSYQETIETAYELKKYPGWKEGDRVSYLSPDAARLNDSAMLPRADIENLKAKNADVLIAPLLAVQRGFNILDDAGGALLGTAFFLVRPVPVPDDLGQYVSSVNAWAMRRLKAEGGYLRPLVDDGASRENSAGDESGENGAIENGKSEVARALHRFRKEAYWQWRRRLEQSDFGLDSIEPDLRDELWWNQFVTVWQCIGRLFRKGRSAHIYYMDSAFDPLQGASMIKAWVEALGQWLGPNPTRPIEEQALAEILYGPAYRVHKRALEASDAVRPKMGRGSNGRGASPVSGQTKQ
jgi:hypothetical protein